MGAAGSSAPGGSPDERASGDAVDQMDALDAMDDDGSPEAEAIHEAAIERVQQIAEAISQQIEPNATDAAGEHMQVEPTRIEPAHVNHEPAELPRVELPAPPHVEAAPAAPAEPAPVPPPTPDRADHDPQ
jgi:hypothetical protein